MRCWPFDRLRSAGFALLSLPRYAPDLSPIEPCWSKLKTLLRTAEPRSLAAIEEQIAPALDTITLEDAQGLTQKTSGYGRESGI